MLVYLITNLINGKRYVGQTTETLERRWKQHQKSSRCRALYSAIQKHGVVNFSIQVLVDFHKIELLNELQAEYIQKYHTLAPNGYNLTEGGRVPRHNAETRAKMSKSHIGVKRPLSVGLKISQIKKGRPRDDETKLKISKTLTGSHWGRTGAVTTNHIRWHVKRNLINSMCELCAG